MASKTKKAKLHKGASKATHNSGGTVKAQEKKIERLELLSQAQDLEHFTTKIQSLQGKLQQLQTEANMTNRDLADIQKEGKNLFTTYNVNLSAFKVKYNVPNNKEVNLRTGELVDPPPQQGAQAPQEIPPAGAPPSVEDESEKASQS